MRLCLKNKNDINKQNVKHTHQNPSQTKHTKYLINVCPTSSTGAASWTRQRRHLTLWVCVLLREPGKRWTINEYLLWLFRGKKAPGLSVHKWCQVGGKGRPCWVLRTWVGWETHPLDSESQVPAREHSVYLGQLGTLTRVGQGLPRLVPKELAVEKSVGRTCIPARLCLPSEAQNLGREEIAQLVKTQSRRQTQGPGTCPTPVTSPV